MKRPIVLLIAISYLMVSCSGNASLWGQYQTPTPPGGIQPSPSPLPTIVNPSTSTPVITLTPEATVTPTATRFDEVFVTQEVASQIESTPTLQGGNPTILYYTQSGDWLPAVARRFGVDVTAITSPKILPEKGLLDPGTLLMIPDVLDRSVPYTPGLQLLPDNEFVFTATAVDFDTAAYVRDAGGYLSAYREYLGSTGWTSGAGALGRVATENSVNPRLLLAILDYESGWVRGRPENDFRITYPLGYENFRNKGVYGQISWAANQLSMGYYGWRSGTLTEIRFSDGSSLRIEPNLNAGTVALMYYFARQHSLNEWLRIMDQTGGFASYYQNMFGDPWSRADAIGPIFPPGISQPEMDLPFEPRAAWAFTGGPHGAWETEGPLAALDFAPASATTGCDPNTRWILSAAPGLVVRSGAGVVVVDMDGDGSEQTGWNILYLHVAAKDRVAQGEWVDITNAIGHASCEGGIATGTHLHIARKYNGEWVSADGPIPFVLSGWTVFAGERPYQGRLVKGDREIIADLYAQLRSLIFREDDE